MLKTLLSLSPVIRNDLIRGNYKQYYIARPKKVGDAKRIAAAGPKAIKNITQRKDNSDKGDRVPLSDTINYINLDNISRLFLIPEK